MKTSCTGCKHCNFEECRRYDLSIWQIMDGVDRCYVDKDDIGECDYELIVSLDALVNKNRKLKIKNVKNNYDFSYCDCDSMLELEMANEYGIGDLMI